MEKVIKTLIDLPLIGILTNLFDTDFYQDLIISLIVCLLNFLILPYIKKGIQKLNLSEKEKKQLQDEVEKIVDKTTNEINKERKDK